MRPIIRLWGHRNQHPQGRQCLVLYYLRAIDDMNNRGAIGPVKLCAIPDGTGDYWQLYFFMALNRASASWKMDFTLFISHGRSINVS